MKKTLLYFISTIVSISSLFALDEVIIRDKPRGEAEIVYVQKLEKRPDGAMRLVIPAEKITVNSEYIRIESPQWKAKKGDEGWYLTPPGALVRFDKDNGNTRADFTMQMFGIKTSQACTMGIVKGLPFELFAFMSAKKGNYNFILHVSTKSLDKRAYEDFIVDFYSFEGDDANYSAMGRKYRQWQMSERGVRSLRERAKERPALAKTIDNILVRFKHGVKPFNKKVEHQTPENEPKPIVMNTFDEMKNFMLAMKEAGIETADIHSVGWNRGGHDGRWPQMFPVEPEFGGETKLRDAIKTAHSLGYQITCHTNYTAASKIAENWTEDIVGRELDGSLMARGIWSCGRVYRQCARQAYLVNFERDCKAILDLGFKGLHHIDVVTCMKPEYCFSPEHYCSRADTVKWWEKVMTRSREIFGGFSSESSADFCAKDLDFAFYVSAYPSHFPKRGKDSLISEIVPLWQIAFHGCILSNPFWDTSDATSSYKRTPPFALFENNTDRILKVVEFGGRPCFYWTNYRKEGVKPIVEMYKLYQPLKYLQYEFMDEHRALADGVYLTRYSNGDETVVNYSKKDFKYKNSIVPAHNYKIFY